MARPVGSVENPATLVRRELKEGLKQQGAIRALVQSQIVEIEKELGRGENLTLSDRLQVLEKLAMISETITKGISGIAKWVIPATGGDEAREQSNARIEDVLKELVKG